MFRPCKIKNFVNNRENLKGETLALTFGNGWVKGEGSGL